MKSASTHSVMSWVCHWASEPVSPLHWPIAKLYGFSIHVHQILHPFPACCWAGAGLLQFQVMPPLPHPSACDLSSFIPVCCTQVYTTLHKPFQCPLATIQVQIPNVNNEGFYASLPSQPCKPSFHKTPLTVALTCHKLT